MEVNRLAILGTGLIGGSVALAARRAGVTLVTGYDPDPEAAEGAAAAGAIDEVCGGPTEASSDADLTVLAMPVDAMPDVASDLDASSGVVTDVGSAKSEIVHLLEDSLGPSFVGGHPMSGSERSGVAGAAADLFEGASWILTPTKATAPEAYSLVRDFVTRLGAVPIALEPETHDRLVARLSHLPQVAASVLIDVAVQSSDREPLLGLAANGFRDVTRIAGSDPQLWVSILRANRGAVLDSIGDFQRGLGLVADLVRAQEWARLESFLSQTQSARTSMFTKPATGPPVTLELVIPDRPGVLAEVTTAAGSLGVNIEDLQIIHSPEGGEGRLELVVAGPNGANALDIALRRLGYSVVGGDQSISRQVDR